LFGQIAFFAANRADYCMMIKQERGWIVS